MKNAANGYWANANDFTYNAAGAAISMQFGNVEDRGQACDIAILLI